MIPDIFVPKYALGILLALVVLFEMRKSSFPKRIYHSEFIRWGLYLKILGAAALLSAAMLPFDFSLLTRIQTFESPVKETLASIGRFFGRSHGSWSVLALLFIAGYCIQKKSLQRLGFFSLLSSCVTGLIVHILKFVFMRARPYKDLGPFVFFDLQGFIDHNRAFQSFPSGDVSVAAGAAGYLLMRTKNIFFRAFLLILPFLTALSRIDLNRHWPSDTLFAIGLGLTVGMFFRDHEQGIMLSPVPSQSRLKDPS